MSEFWERYKDIRWRQKRAEILANDNYTCRKCQQKGKPMQLHHTHYVSAMNPWEYEDDDLVPLCEDCHKEITEKDKLLRKMCGQLTHFYDRILGYVAGLHAELLGGDFVLPKDDHAKSYFVRGLADIFKINVEEVVTALSQQPNGDVVFNSKTIRTMLGKFSGVHCRDQVKLPPVDIYAEEREYNEFMKRRRDQPNS